MRKLRKLRLVLGALALTFALGTATACTSPVGPDNPGTAGPNSGTAGPNS